MDKIRENDAKWVDDIFLVIQRHSNTWKTTKVLVCHLYA